MYLRSREIVKFRIFLYNRNKSYTLLTPFLTVVRILLDVVACASSLSSSRFNLAI